MAKYRYTGPGPIEVLSGGELTRPGDVREFGADPDWGAWELVPPPEAGEGTEPPGPPAESPAPPPAPVPAPFAAPPVTPEGT